MGVQFLGLRKHRAVERAVGMELHRVCVWSHSHGPGYRDGYFYTMDGRRGNINLATLEYEMLDGDYSDRIQSPSTREIYGQRGPGG